MMRQIYTLLWACCLLLGMAACSEEAETTGKGGTGYLRLSVSGSGETTTKAANLPKDYTGEQLAVEIANAKDSVIWQTDDWSEWAGKQIPLAAGQYTVRAHSYGFDGKQSAMAAPYYYGSAEVTIASGREANAKVTCTLANVKVSVKVGDDLRKKFRSFGVSLQAKDGTSCDPLTFNIDLAAATIADTAYFPATDLVVSYSAVSSEGGKQNSASYDLKEVQPKDHFILNFVLQQTGGGNLTVDVDETMNSYTYTFKVPLTQGNGVNLSANAWAGIAYLKAESLTAQTGTDLASLKFQYREKGAESWNDTEASLEAEVYSGKTGALKPATVYEYRLINADESFDSSISEFTTEEAVALYNGGFDSWYNNGSTWYAMENLNNGIFWDSSNPGTTTGAGAMVGINPTLGVESPRHSDTGKAAELRSQDATFLGVAIKLAAASLYTGEFQELSGTNGAKIKFGQPFESRPIALHGWYQYAPAKVNWSGSHLKEGDTDVCALYFALVTEQYVVNNAPGKDQFLMDFNTDKRVLAFGELPADMCKSTGGEWKEFTINLKYKSLDKPEKLYIVVLASASRYGDYFEGAHGSVMYLDDFSLVYDGEPALWK